MWLGHYGCGYSAADWIRPIRFGSDPMPKPKSQKKKRRMARRKGKKVK